MVDRNIRLEILKMKLKNALRLGTLKGVPERNSRVRPAGRQMARAYNLYNLKQ